MTLMHDIRHVYNMASKGNISAVLHGVGDLRIEELPPISPPAKGEVQIAMRAVGICGSDVHFYKHMNCAGFIINDPIVQGHESSGVVAEVGECVTHLKVGDRVAIEPGVPCHICSLCKGGSYNLCSKMKLSSIPPTNGCLCRCLNHAADFCYKLPDHVSFEEGALLEPLSIAVHACRRAGITAGDNVLVCGAGPIGLVNLLTAKAFGATKVAITDLEEGRLAKAKELGADYTIKVESRNGKEVAKKIMEQLGTAADKTIECTGEESSIHTGIYVTKSGGVLVLVGLEKDEINLPIVNALVREVDIRGACLHDVKSYPTALTMVASGAVNVKPLVTHHFKLEESKTAFETFATKKGGAIKVMIHCDQ